MILDEALMNQKIQQDLERKNANQILDEMLADQQFKDKFVQKYKVV